MDKEAQVWNEYQSLRSEVTHADSLNYQTISIVVGAAGVILTAGLNQSDPIPRSLIFLCVYIVTIPGYRLLQGNRRRIWRISTYIRTFLEPNLEFVKWETRLDSSRKKPTSENVRQGLSSLIGMNEWFIVTMINLIAGAATTFSLMGLSEDNPISRWRIIFIAGVILINVWLIFITARQEKDLRRLGKVEQGFLNSWSELRDKESRVLPE